MPIIPIGTEIRLRKPPIGNYALIAVNVLVFLYTDFLGGAHGQQFKNLCTLYSAVPDLGQYISYQFLHGDFGHLAGNMLFLWIFGNAVCDRMGSLTYVLFYVAGGVFAAVVFSARNDSGLLGASGAIAAVTTAFLVLFPRVRITMFVWFLVITAIQVPAMVLIVFKVILWDNVIAPMFDTAPVANVAYSAHLGGYAFGFVVGMALLAGRALPRNQFDLLALWGRWRRRSGWGERPRPSGRAIEVQEVDSRPLEPLQISPQQRLRQEIIDRVGVGDLSTAVELYQELCALDPQQVLPREVQLELANYLAQTRRHAEAAGAYEAFLEAYPGTADEPEIRLLLGLIYSRYLREFRRAAEQLRRAASELKLAAQRALAEQELQQVEAQLYGPPPDAS